MQQLKEVESSYGSDSHETQKTINSLNEIKKIRNLDDDMLSDENSEKDEESDNESIVFSSESKNS